MKKAKRIVAPDGHAPLQTPEMVRWLEGLSCRQKDCILLSSQGYGEKEIASMLGCATKTVSGHLALARAMIRNKIRTREDLIVAEASGLRLGRNTYTMITGFPSKVNSRV